MPIYEFACRQCGHNFERLVLRTSPSAECLVCGHGDLDQLVSICAVSSDSSKQANLSAAHRKAATVRQDKQRKSHKHLHENFHDPAVPELHSRLNNASPA
jgi:putative FmdB family regulatory protein